MFSIPSASAFADVKNTMRIVPDGPKPVGHTVMKGHLWSPYDSAALRLRSTASVAGQAIAEVADDQAKCRGVHSVVQHDALQHTVRLQAPAYTPRREILRIPGRQLQGNCSSMPAVAYSTRHETLKRSVRRHETTAKDSSSNAAVEPPGLVQLGGPPRQGTADVAVVLTKSCSLPAP